MEIVQGIILKTSPYSETQKIIRIYTKEKGYLSMISPSVVFKRKTKTVHLLQISEIEFFENEKSDLHKLRQISPIINLPELYFDIFKMNILLLWGEILNLILKNEGKNEELFDYQHFFMAGELRFQYQRRELLSFRSGHSVYFGTEYR